MTVVGQKATFTDERRKRTFDYVLKYQLSSFVGRVQCP